MARAHRRLRGVVPCPGQLKRAQLAGCATLVRSRPEGFLLVLLRFFAAHRRGCERVREVSERGRHSSPRVHTTTMR